MADKTAPVEKCVIELGSPLWIPKKRTTILAVIVATIGSFGLGTVLVWSAVALPQITESLKTDFGLSDSDVADAKSWIASVPMLGALISAPVTGFSIAKWGRKSTMLGVAFPFMLGWAFIAWFPNMATLYVGRFVTGFCGGAFTVAIPAYVSEITEDKIRGTLGSVMILMLVTGILFTFVLGAVVSWFWLSISCGIIPIVFFLSMLFMPESPRYLLSQGKSQDASKALEWLRRASKKRYIEPELEKIEHSLKSGNEQSAKIKDLIVPEVMRPIIVSAVLIFFQQACGVNGVSFYTVDVFKSSGVDMDANVASIIITACQVLAVLFAPVVLVDRMGRKVLLVASELIMIVSLIALGAYFYVKETGDKDSLQSLSWLPLTALVSYIVGYNVGVGPIPFVLMGEVLPNHVKEMGSSIVSSVYWILSFLAAWSFEKLAASLGWSGFYWMSAGICAAGIIFIVAIIPETKGRSIDDIQKSFLTKRESVTYDSRQASLKSTRGQIQVQGFDNPTLEL